MVDVEELLPLINKIARSVCLDYPDVNSDDIAQAMALFVVQNAKSIKSRAEGGNPNWILKRVAHQYARQERAQQMSMSMQYTYRLSDVKKALEGIYSIENLDTTPVPDDAHSLSGNDSMDIGSDIRAAIELMSDDDKIILFRRYALGEIPDNASYERKLLNRATKRLVFRLNSYRGAGQYTGKRRVISNAAARARMAGDW